MSPTLILCIFSNTKRRQGSGFSLLATSLVNNMTSKSGSSSERFATSSMSASLKNQRHLIQQPASSSRLLCIVQISLIKDKYYNVQKLNLQLVVLYESVKAPIGGISRPYLCRIPLRLDVLEAYPGHI